MGKEQALEKVKTLTSTKDLNHVDDAEEERIRRMFEAAAESAPMAFLPEQVKKAMLTMAPAIGKVGAAGEVAAPIVAHGVVEAWKLYQKLPKRIAYSLWGV